VIAVRALSAVLVTIVVAVLGPTAAPAAAVKDRPAPTSNAIPPAYSTATTFEVPYTASSGRGASEPARVDLYVKAPGEALYSLAATDATPETPAFSYQATAGDGSYAFYTVAVAQLGDIEAPPLLGDDGSTVVDTVAPTSAAAAPATVASPPIDVSYKADDGGGSGVGRVELWVKPPNAGSYSLAGIDDTPESPSFSYVPTSGGGAYSFATVAMDRAGNREPATLGADAETSYTGAAPKTGDINPVLVAQLPGERSAPSLPLVAALAMSPKQTLKGVIADGIRFRLYAYRPITLTLSAALTRRTARTLGLRRHPTIATHRYHFASPGIYDIRLRVKHRATLRLRRARTATFILRSVVSTAAGKTSSVTQVRLRR
jgi:hypothetical protein